MQYPRRMGSVITVSGAVGGVGTSTLAYAIASQLPQSAVLIDAQPSGTPIELLIGGESEPGTRWHQIHVATPDIDPETVLAALPSWNGLRFLSANVHGTAHQPALSHLVDALRRRCELVVVDVDARSDLIDVIQPDLRLLAVPNTIYGLGAAVAAVHADTEIVVMRSHLEDFRPEEIGKYIGNPIHGPVEIERVVWLALRTRSPLPMNTSVMQVADQLVTRIANAA